jgi:UDP-N-acetylmuramoyl-tripeptide--D-alanyl-D-alanine ligase
MSLSITLRQLVNVLSHAGHRCYLANVDPTAFDAPMLDPVVHSVETDSRHLSVGSVFLALSGETFDGHDFVMSAMEQGAIAAIVAEANVKKLETLDELRLPLVVVPDPLTAYQAIATWWRHQCSAKIIAVTGSVGKTTTKELIAAVLAQHGRVLKTRANYNNEIGVPKTLLELQPDHDYAVVEMGMRAMGEIAVLARVAQPDIAVITNVGTAHIGRLGSEEAIAQAKCELLAQSSPSAIAILNADNPLLMETAARVWAGRTLTFGLDQGDLTAQFISPNTLVMGDKRLPLPLPGRHNALNYLAAIAVAQALELDWSGLADGLKIELPSGRAQRYVLPNDIVILDETYNAGVESMMAALQLLADMPGRRHIAVLGTMKELGDRSVDLHTQVGQRVADLGLDHLLILADPAEREALKQGATGVSTEWFEDHAALVRRLRDLMREGDRLLFKASRAVALDQVVAQVRQHEP